MASISELVSSRRGIVQVVLWILGFITFIVYLGVVSRKVATANQGSTFDVNFRDDNGTQHYLPAWVFYTIGGGTFGPKPKLYPTCMACCDGACVAVPMLNTTEKNPWRNFTDLSYAYNWAAQLGRVEFKSSRYCPRIDCQFPLGTELFGITLYDHHIPVDKIRSGGIEEKLPGGWFDVRIDQGYGGWVLWKKEVYLLKKFEHLTDNETVVSYTAMGTTSAPMNPNDPPFLTMIPGTGYTTIYKEVTKSTHYDGSIFLGNVGGFLMLIIIGYFVTMTILETLLPSLKSVDRPYQTL